MLSTGCNFGVGAIVLLLLLVGAPHSFGAAGPAAVSSPASYSAFDDVSWAVWDVNLSPLLGDKQSIYDNHIEDCRKAAGETRADSHCYVAEYRRMQMNMYQPRSMYNYTEMGFKKIRAPKELFDAINAFWQANRNQTGATEWSGDISVYHNHWDVPPTMLNIQHQRFTGGGPDLAAFVSDKAREVLEEWTGQVMAGTSVYGIRVYHNDSILTPHVDRLPLVTSAIINVDQDVDEPWPLEVYDHNGVAHNITMEPGDMILYESHSVIHGRPFPMRGSFFANIFVHFEVIGETKSEDLAESGGLPPYVVPGSSWEPEYWKDFPQGWKILQDIDKLVQMGDLRTFKYIVERRPEVATMCLDCKAGWQPIHEAVRDRHMRMVKYLIEEAGVDVNEPYYIPFPFRPLDVAYATITDKSHPIFDYLKSKGAVETPTAQRTSPRQRRQKRRQRRMKKAHLQDG